MKSGHSVIVFGLSTRREDSHQSRSTSGFPERNCRAPSNVPERTIRSPPKTAIAEPPRRARIAPKPASAGEGRQESGDEVVGELRRQAGRARGKREEVRPEVIVGKALAGEPGVGKRQA